MTSTKYQILMERLATVGTGEMTCFGSSMLPILKSGSTVTFERRTSYAVGDIVFSKVKGRFVDCHLITKVRADGHFMISNNSGHENGWTHTVYGKAVKATYKGVSKDL